MLNTRLREVSIYIYMQITFTVKAMHQKQSVIQGLIRYRCRRRNSPALPFPINLEYKDWPQAASGACPSIQITSTASSSSIETFARPKLDASEYLDQPQHTAEYMMMRGRAVLLGLDTCSVWYYSAPAPAPATNRVRTDTHAHTHTQT